MSQAGLLNLRQLLSIFHGSKIAMIQKYLFLSVVLRMMLYRRDNIPINCVLPVTSPPGV